MQRLTTGNYRLAVPGLGCAVEIGAMAASVEVFKINGVEMGTLRAEQERSRQLSEAERRTWYAAS